MDKENIDIAGAAITSMFSSDLPDAVNEEAIKKFKEDLPPEGFEKRLELTRNRSANLEAKQAQRDKRAAKEGLTGLQKKPEDPAEQDNVEDAPSADETLDFLDDLSAEGAEPEQVVEKASPPPEPDTEPPEEKLSTPEPQVATSTIEPDESTTSAAKIPDTGDDENIDDILGGMQEEKESAIGDLLDDIEDLGLEKKAPPLPLTPDDQTSSAQAEVPPTEVDQGPTQSISDILGDLDTPPAPSPTDDVVTPDIQAKDAPPGDIPEEPEPSTEDLLNDFEVPGLDQSDSLPAEKDAPATQSPEVTPGTEAETTRGANEGNVSSVADLLGSFDAPTDQPTTNIPASEELEKDVSLNGDEDALLQDLSVDIPESVVDKAVDSVEEKQASIKPVVVHDLNALGLTGPPPDFTGLDDFLIEVKLEKDPSNLSAGLDQVPESLSALDTEVQESITPIPQNLTPKDPVTPTVTSVESTPPVSEAPVETVPTRTEPSIPEKKEDLFANIEDVETPDIIEDEDLPELEISTGSLETGGEGIQTPTEASGQKSADPDLETAFAYLRTFKEINKMIVFRAITDKVLIKSEVDDIFNDLLNKKDEEEIVEKIYTLLVKTQKAKAPLRVGTEDIARPAFFDIIKTNFIPIMGVLFAGVFVIWLISFIFSETLDWINAERYYSKGLTEIEKFNFVKSEEYFEKAWTLGPSVEKCNEYAARYINLNRFHDAERKYRKALKYKPDDFETLFNFGKMFVIKEDYPTAENKLHQLEKSYPDEIAIPETIGMMYIEWGRKDRNKLTNAAGVFQALSDQESEEPLYLAKLMQIKVLLNDFYGAKKYENEITDLDPDYVDPYSYLDLVDYYIDIYEDKYGPDSIYEFEEKLNVKIRDEQLYIVRTVDEVTGRIKDKESKNIRNYYEVARWNYILKKYNRASYFAGQGTKSYEKYGSPKNFNPGKLYDIKGKAQVELGDVVSSMEHFQSSIDIDPHNPIPYLYLGKISLMSLGNLEKGLGYFNQAKLNWDTRHNKEYSELLHGLAYTYYYSTNWYENHPQKNVEMVKKSLNYWTELEDLLGGNYVLDYAIGNSYLRLREYDLAEAEFKSSLGALSKFMKLYSYNSGNVSETVKDKMYILSDLYNNIAVAQMGKAYKNERPLFHKKEALNNLINSIDLKDKIGIVKGIPNANFNAINNPEVASSEHLKIGDNFVPKDLTVLN